jgi:hypothetical protein
MKPEKLRGIGDFSKSMDFDQIEDADQNCSIEEATFDQSIYQIELKKSNF